MHVRTMHGKFLFHTADIREKISPFSLLEARYVSSALHFYGHTMGTYLGMESGGEWSCDSVRDGCRF